MSALLELDRARIDDGGVPAIDGLSLSTTGDHLLVLGAPRALFEAVSGVRPLAHGTITVNGESPRQALRAGKLAGAPLDPPLPPRWSARAYVTWSARLAGLSRGAARAAADEALARMKLQSVADARIARSAAAMRRGVVIAAALATGADIVVLEDPLVALPESQARTIARVTAEALEDRRTIVFASRVTLASPMSLASDEAIVIAGSRIAAQGAPAEIAAHDRRYAMRVEGNAEALAKRLRELGARVSGSPQAMSADLGDLTTREVFAAAIEHGAVIVELRPSAGAFA